MPAVHGKKFKQNILYDLEPLNHELNFISSNADSVTIGSMSRLSDIVENKTVIAHLPQLVKAINSIGSSQIRSMATLAGNVANASPVADSIPVLITTDTLVHSISIKGERSIPINDFFIDYKKTSLAKNEIIKAITIPFNKLGGKYDFYKVATHQDTDISKINLAYSIEPESTRFAAGGVSKMVVRLRALEKAWSSQLTVMQIRDLIAKDISPISDIRSTSEYRETTLSNLLFSLCN